MLLDDVHTLGGVFQAKLEGLTGMVTALTVLEDGRVASASTGKPCARRLARHADGWTR
jgi:hypothetical protein